MKILVVGDLHGRLSSKLFSKIKKLKPDMILSPGDYCGNSELSKLFFEKVYGKDEEEIDSSVLRKVEFLEKKSVQSGIDVLKKLKTLKIPFYGVRGNWDPSPWEMDIGSDEDKQKEFGLKKFNREFRKDFELIDFRVKDFGNFVVVGGTSSTHPGKLKVGKSRLKKYKGNKNELRKYLKRKKMHYQKREKKYRNVFEKAKKKGKPIIFLTHNCPYMTKLDKIKKGPQKGKHYGSYLEKQMIKKYKPELVLCGHMHENFGKDKLYGNLVINSGAALNEEFVVLEFPPKKGGKLKVRFCKQ
jgi:Icc-related predicted phosphoesterase